LTTPFAIDDFTDTYWKQINNIASWTTDEIAPAKAKITISVVGKDDITLECSSGLQRPGKWSVIQAYVAE